METALNAPEGRVATTTDNPVENTTPFQPVPNDGVRGKAEAKRPARPGAPETNGGVEDHSEVVEQALGTKLHRNGVGGGCNLKESVSNPCGGSGCISEGQAAVGYVAMSGEQGSSDQMLKDVSRALSDEEATPTSIAAESAPSARPDCSPSEQALVLSLPAIEVAGGPDASAGSKDGRLVAAARGLGLTGSDGDGWSQVDGVVEGADSHPDDDVPADQLQEEVRQRWGRLHGVWIAFALAVEQVWRRKLWKNWGHSNFSSYVREDLNASPATIKKMVHSVEYIRTHHRLELKKIRALFRSGDPGDRLKLPSYTDLDEMRRLELRVQKGKLTTEPGMIEQMRRSVLQGDLGGNELRSKLKELKRKSVDALDSEQPSRTGEEASDGEEGPRSSGQSDDIEAVSSNSDANEVAAEVNGAASTSLVDEARTTTQDAQHDAQLVEATGAEVESTDASQVSNAVEAGAEPTEAQNPARGPVAASVGPLEELDEILTRVRTIADSMDDEDATPDVRDKLAAIQAACTASSHTPGPLGDLKCMRDTAHRVANSRGGTWLTPTMRAILVETQELFTSLLELPDLSDPPPRRSS